MNGTFDGAIAARWAVRSATTAIDEEWGRQALRVPAHNARVGSVAHPLARGADANLRDPEQQQTALDWCVTDATTSPTAAPMTVSRRPCKR
jgi:hypothetical protein